MRLIVFYAPLLLAATLFGASSVHEFTLNSIDGVAAPLAAYRGKIVIGFPANNFGAQEPGTNDEIKTFCTRTYHVTFPMYGKISVKGEDKAPLDQYLTGAKGGDIKWNFTKFLAGKDGKVIVRFDPNVTPESPQVAAAIEKALAQ